MIFFLPQTPSHIYCCRFVTLAIVSGGILFPLVFLIGISAAIRNAGILFGGGGLSLCFLFFFFFTLKGMRTI